MGKLGIRWSIGGVGAAFITRGTANGRYCVTFERDTASLEQIEGIHWEAPELQRLTEHTEEPGLPEGYGFDLVDIRYDHGTRVFVAELKTASQYLGDVSGYQEQVRELEKTAAEQNATLEAYVAETAAMTEGMAAAYQEGVEKHG